MYYKLNENVLFRKYNSYGYLTDNSLFGYKTKKSDSWFPGEKYLSESAAVMIEVLEKKPLEIDEIVDKLLKIFIDVTRGELKNDVICFYNELVDDGFLSKGETVNECELKTKKLNTSTNKKNTAKSIVENCTGDMFKQSDFLRSIHIEIASECNERCVHCYIPHKFKLNCIDSDLFNKIIDEGKQLNIINVVLSGGEPLLHKDIIKLLEKCRKSDLSVNLLTNLTLLTDEIFAEMIRNPLLSVQTSIYSMDPLVHDSITKVKGSFLKTMRSLKKVYDAGIPIQISCPVMKQNLQTFYDVVQWGEEKGITVATEFVIFGMYDHSNCNLNNRLSLTEIEKAFEMNLTSECAKSYLEVAKEKECLTSNDSVCSICKYNFCVSAEGYVYPCVGWNNNVVGDLNQQTIYEIWTKSKEVRRLRNIKMDSFSRCLECNDRGYCTICMMLNSNENSDGNEFNINDFHCKVAKIKHDKVKDYIKNMKIKNVGGKNI
ncbi:PqqD family peptide modification chaperone [Thomasclavelia spiroformis]|uniref:radical SAM protein n=1 Tax=Thomasclavelia spiroformis TaxID=29348 RepID=UPI0039913857